MGTCDSCDGPALPCSLPCSLPYSLPSSCSHSLPPSLPPSLQACLLGWSITFIIGFIVQKAAPGDRELGHFISISMFSAAFMAWLGYDFPSIEETMEADQVHVGKG